VDDQGVVVQIPDETRGFVLSQLIQNSSGTHTSYFLGFEGDHPPPSSAKTINKWAISSLPPVPSHCAQG